MYLESSAVVTPDPADPSTYSVQDYAGVAVPWADVIRVRHSYDNSVIATVYRHDNGWYTSTPPGGRVEAYYASWDLVLWPLLYTGEGYHPDEVQELIESGWA